jgi:hypothetical protein
MVVGSGMANLIYTVQANFNDQGWFNVNGWGAVGNAQKGYRLFVHFQRLPNH